MLILSPQNKDLGGGFVVRRLLPAVSRRSVGPFVFFDHFGPTVTRAGQDHDVRPHPHIGLATVTYLFEGAMMHRDSLGVVQRIEPGAINLMTAGRGIAHSERTPDELRAVERRSHGLQLWLALPSEREEVEPSFSHTPAADIPGIELRGGWARLLVGSAFGATSPVPAHSPTLYMDLALEPGATLELPPLAEEMALYTVEGSIRVDGTALPEHAMAVLPGASRIDSVDGGHAVLVGGRPLGERFMWWNFVSSRKERIAQAAQDWAEGRFAPVPGETEFIPLPEKRPPTPEPMS